MPAACSDSHRTSQLVQGPGVCCAALTSSGTTTVAVGTRVVATNSRGQCIICEVKRGKKGGLVWKRGKAQQPGSPAQCPTTREGCCALAGL